MATVRRAAPDASSFRASPPPPPPQRQAKTDAATSANRRVMGLLSATARSDEGRVYRVPVDAARGGGVASIRASMPGGSILVVEDEVAVRDLILDILQGAGYKVTGAGDGVEGL